MRALELVDLQYAYSIKSSRGWRARRQVHWALRGVDLSIDPGECFGVVGTNGSGKTTLLQCVTGVLRPTAGRVEVAGRVAALVHLFAGFHRELTGRENLMVVGVLNGMSRREVQARSDEIIAFSGLDPDVLDEPFRTYSAGMGLRLGFAVAVHTQPKVLVVDEVLAVGDEQFHRRCLDRVAELRGGGCAVVIVSHELDLVTRECERVAWLDEGRVIETGRAADVVERYRREAKPEVVGDHHAELHWTRESRRHKARRRL